MTPAHKITLLCAFASMLFLAFAFTSVERRSVPTPRFGICDLSTIPLRGTASHRSEVVTQMLFGEAYTVLEETWDQEWFYIRMHADQYEGWIPASQFREVSTEYFIRYREANHVVQQTPIAKVMHPKMGTFFLSIGSVLPFYEQGAVKIGEEVFEVSSVDGADIAKKLMAKNEADAVLNTALKYIHAPYLWGGKSIFGIDCSGFVQQVFKSARHLSLPRDSYQQAALGTEVGWMEAQPGDLAFFKNEKGKIVHVGIVMGDQQIIHASGKVRIDRLTAEGIFAEDFGKHTHQLAFVKRI